MKEKHRVNHFTRAKTSKSDNESVVYACLLNIDTL